MRKQSLHLLIFLAQLVTLGAQALAQSKAPTPIEFDVSSVMPNRSGRVGHDGVQIFQGNLTVRNVSLKMLIEAAYGVQATRIVGGPAWLSSDR